MNKVGLQSALSAKLYMPATIEIRKNCSHNKRVGHISLMNTILDMIIIIIMHVAMQNVIATIDF